MAQTGYGVSFHNTTELQGLQLQQKENKALKQDDLVMQLMKRFKRMTGSDVHAVWGLNAPLTSARRSLSNLKNAGKVRRLEEMKTGVYGDPEHYYELIERVEQGKLF